MTATAQSSEMMQQTAVATPANMNLTGMNMTQVTSFLSWSGGRQREKKMRSTSLSLNCISNITVIAHHHQLTHTIFVNVQSMNTGTWKAHSYTHTTQPLYTRAMPARKAESIIYHAKVDQSIIEWFINMTFLLVYVCSWEIISTAS